MSTFSSFGVEVAAESEDPGVEAPATPNVVQAMEDSAVASPSGFTRGSGSILGKRSKAAMASYSPRATQLRAEAEIEAISPAGADEYITVSGATPASPGSELPPSYLSIGGDEESEAPASSEFDAAAGVLAAKAAEAEDSDGGGDDDELPSAPDANQFKVSPVRTVCIGKNGAGKFGFQVGNGLDIGVLPCIEGVGDDKADINYLTDERPLEKDIILNINGENALLLTHAQILALIGGLSEITFQLTTPDRAVPRNDEDNIDLKMLLATESDDEATAPYKAAVTNLVHSFVPWTTRPKREGEKQGREYHFVDHAAFLIKLKSFEFYEHATHPTHGYLYGTPFVTDEQLENGEPEKRTAALQKLKGIRSKEASVHDVHFDDVVPKGQSISEFLATSDHKHPETKVARQKLKAAIYDKTIPYTTRAARLGEVEGIDYHFVSAQVFREMLEEDLFLEHGTFHGFEYGTTRITAEEANSSFSKKATFQKLSGRDSGEATISELMEPTEYHGHHELEITGGLTITEFLKSVGPDSVELGKFHHQVVVEIHKAVHPMTTRPPKEGEEDGVDYHFVSQDDFDAHLANHDFLETGVGPEGFSYGTLKPTAAMLGYDRSKGGHPDSHDTHMRIDRRPVENPP